MTMPGPNGWRLGTRDEVQAAWNDGQLLVAARGRTPNAGVLVDIERSLVDRDRPEFVLRFRQKPGLWTQALTPYRHGEVFAVPVRPDLVRVHHEGGVDDVAVSADVVFLPGPLPGMATPGRPTDTATGYSASMAFDEAFRDALANLPPPDREYPDMLQTVRVDEIGAMLGGFAGFHRMYVKVSRTLG